MKVIVIIPKTTEVFHHVHVIVANIVILHCSRFIISWMIITRRYTIVAIEKPQKSLLWPMWSFYISVAQMVTAANMHLRGIAVNTSLKLQTDITELAISDYGK